VTRIAPLHLVLTLALVAAPAAFGQVLPLSHSDLCKSSDHVIRGKVTGESVRRDGTIIVTDYTLTLLEQWKGTVTGPIVITIPGGTLDGVTLRVSEVASLKVGEEVVVFTVAKETHHEIFGCYRGKYTIVRDHIRELKQTSVDDLRKELKSIISGK
jgi:hypothetical protein